MKKAYLGTLVAQFWGMALRTCIKNNKNGNYIWKWDFEILNNLWPFKEGYEAVEDSFQT
jgi:hypothetical protein